MIHENVDKAKKSSGCPSQGGGGDMAQKQQEQQAMIKDALGKSLDEDLDHSRPVDVQRDGHQIIDDLVPISLNIHGTRVI